MRDAIIAIERYYLNDVQESITTLAANTVGINNSATGSARNTNAYSIAKVDELIAAVSSDLSTTNSNLTSLQSTVTALSNKQTNDEEKDRRIWSVSVDTSGWSSSYPFTKTVTVNDMASSYSPVWSLDVSSYSNATADQNRYKIQLKAITTNAGSITIKCSKKPTVDFKLIGKGI